MHKAKAFFYVCAGLFLLALSYHLGARNAHGQGGLFVEAADVNGITTAVAGRTMYQYDNNGVTVAPTSIPGSSPVVAAGWVSYHGGGPRYVAAVLENGDIYEAASGDGAGVSNVGSWSLAATLSGPVPTTRETFGALKNRYRQQGPAQSAPQDR